MTDDTDADEGTIEVDRTLAWAVGFAADGYTPDGLAVDRYPFSYRLDVLVRANAAFREREGRSWRAAAPTAADEGVDPAPVEGTTTVSLDADLRARLADAVAAEYPDRDVASLAPDALVDLLVAAWNDHAGGLAPGWRVPDR